MPFFLTTSFEVSNRAAGLLVGFSVFYRLADGRNLAPVLTLKSLRFISPLRRKLLTSAAFGPPSWGALELAGGDSGGKLDGVRADGVLT